MVRREYFDQIVAGTKTEEIRRHTKRWDTIAQKTRSYAAPVQAVFLCGRRVHRRWLRHVEEWESAEKFLGRPLSAQGKKDVGTGPVIVFHLGDMA